MEYALRAMLLLAEASTDKAGPLSIEALAHRQNLPSTFLEPIAADLKRAGLVHSVLGSKGGYQLTREPTDISLGDVLRAVDGPLVQVRGLPPEVSEYAGVAEHLSDVWAAVQESVSRVLDRTSLHDVVASPHRVANSGGLPVVDLFVVLMFTAAASPPLCRGRAGGRPPRELGRCCGR
jgi:Rrf2 family protein